MPLNQISQITNSSVSPGACSHSSHGCIITPDCASVPPGVRAVVAPGADGECAGGGRASRGAAGCGGVGQVSGNCQGV